MSNTEVWERDREQAAKVRVLAQIAKHASLPLLNETLALALQGRQRHAEKRVERLGDVIERTERAIALLEGA